MDTKKYLEDLSMLESSCYEQKQLLTQLQQQLSRLKSTPEKKHIGGKYKDESGLGLYIFVIPLIIVLFFEIIGLNILGYVLGAIVLFVQWLITRPTEERKHNEKERQRVLAENKKIDEYNKAFREKLPARCSALSTQIRRTENSLAETHNTLNKLYSLDIIYPKYRTMAAVTSFYEYFSSGRCTELTGHEGAYNIFEEEIQRGIISDKLDIVIQKLDQIQHNQYTLTQAIRKSNRMAEQIYSKICQCADRLESIDMNTTITGYFSAISAANTSYLVRYYKSM